MTLQELLNPVTFTDAEMDVIKGIDPLRASFCEYLIQGHGKINSYKLAKQNTTLSNSSANKQACIWYSAYDIQLYLRYLKSINRELFGDTLQQVFENMTKIALGTKVSVTTTQETRDDGTKILTVSQVDDVKTQLEAGKTILGMAGIGMETRQVGTQAQIQLIDDI